MTVTDLTAQARALTLSVAQHDAMMWRTARGAAATLRALVRLGLVDARGQYTELGQAYRAMVLGSR